MTHSYFAYLIARETLSTGDRYWHSARVDTLRHAAELAQTMMRLEESKGYAIEEAGVQPDDRAPEVTAAQLQGETPLARVNLH